MIEIIRDYWQLYLGVGSFSGLPMTLWLLVLVMCLAFVASVPLAILRASNHKAISRAIWFYTFVIRGTPLYVQLLLVYTGLYSLSIIQGTPFLANFFRNGFDCVIFAFCINECAYLTEILADGISSVPAGEIEAAHAFGFSRPLIYAQVVLPSAIKRSLPYYGNEAILLLHSTSIAFTATVPELLKVAYGVNSITYAPFASFGFAAILYAVIAFVLVAGFRALEKHWLIFLGPQKA